LSFVLIGTDVLSCRNPIPAKPGGVLFPVDAL
jgi:hypothetical protein